MSFKNHEKHPKEEPLILTEEEKAFNFILNKKANMADSMWIAQNKGMRVDMWIKLKGQRMGFFEYYTPKERMHFIAFFSKSKK